MGKILKNGLAILFIAIICCLIVEFVLRWTCTFCNYMEKNKQKYTTIYDDASYSSWLHQWSPNTTNSYYRPEFDSLTNEIITNSLGLRDIEHPLMKDSNEVRILAIGDSFTEGVGVPFNKTWLNTLGHNLKNDYDSLLFRMINGGVSGSDPIFGFILLQQKLLAYQPDIVVLFINYSDVTDMVMRGGKERFLPNGKVKFAPKPWGEALFQKSHFARGISMVFLGKDQFFLSKEDRKKREAKMLEDLKAILLEFESLAQQNGFRFITIYHPMNNEAKFPEYRPFKSEIADLKAFAKENQLHFFDLWDYFDQSGQLTPENFEKWYWPLDGHCNAEGYAKFAEGIQYYLEQSGILENVLNQ